MIRLEKNVVKRDGSIETFKPYKIWKAIDNCYSNGLGYVPILDMADVVNKVTNIVAARYEQPTVEQVSDTIEIVLQSIGEYDAAKAFIIYRHDRAKERENSFIPEDVRTAFAGDQQYFPTPLQYFQFLDKYSRWNYDAGRRETWVQTVDRTVDYLHELASPYHDFGNDFYLNMRSRLLRMEVTPSMRMYAMAGAPARRDNTAIYNCSYMPVQDLQAFVEAMYISMAGCGVGYSVESKYVDQLPLVMKQYGKIYNYNKFVIEDSTEGWGVALALGLERWFSGDDVDFDFSEIRPVGSVLRIKGGRASGHGPLEKLFKFLRGRILSRQGQKLTTLDAHDLMCAIGNAVVSGGVRRTAMISLFDHDDMNMLTCKDGDFETENSQRWNANNSAVWPNNITPGQFITQFHTMYANGRGEPGIFSREAALSTMPNRRSSGNSGVLWGTNPCGEIVLKPWQFCNLTAVVARKDDTLATLEDKVYWATTIGTIQSLATHFPNLRREWNTNCEAERLCGVDITGQHDARHILDGDVFNRLRGIAYNTNLDLSQKLGINQSASITCVKPSGNTSQLVDCSSGIHARMFSYYIRNVRVAATSAVYKVLRDAGVPLNPENGSDPNNIVTYVASFPVASPEGSVTVKDTTAISQLEWWLTNKLNWTEHNPSITVTYEPNEIMAVMQWVWEHKEVVGGLALLPKSNANYNQLPYIEITKEEYHKLSMEFPVIDWARLYLYEKADYTTAAQELACMAGACSVEEYAGS